MWLFVLALVLLQFLSVLLGSMTTEIAKDYSQSPLKGPTQVVGLNNDPFSDRAVVCVLQGRSYVPFTVNDALALGPRGSSTLRGHRSVATVSSSKLGMP